jgi:XTP/dITP diphosphohydrolase
MELIFATNNLHKLQEIQKLLTPNFKLVSLKELGVDEDIPETGDTLNANASEKAWYIYNKFGKNCFADDTGLEVEKLNNEPGVYSARYAGDEKDPIKNMALLLKKLDGETNRKACFRTVIALIIDGKEHQFEGRVDGTITTSPMGEQGFGYDPIFMPNTHPVTFAQLNLAEKNAISHRGNAIRKLVEFLTAYKQ